MRKKRSKKVLICDFYAISGSIEPISKIMVKALAPRYAIFYVDSTNPKELQEQKTFQKCDFCVTEGPRNMKFGQRVTYWI